MMIQNVKCRGYESSPHLGSSLRGPGELGGGRRLATEYASGSGKFAAAAGVVCGGGLCVLCILRRPLDFAWYYSLGRARTHTHCVPLFAVVCMWHTHKHTHTHANTHKYTHTPPTLPTAAASYSVGKGGPSIGQSLSSSINNRSVYDYHPGPVHVMGGLTCLSPPHARAST